MPRTASRWTIDGMHPAEYGTLWGCGTRDGMRFYNACAQDSRDGGPCGNPEWGPDEWNALAEVARTMGAKLARDAARARSGYKPSASVGVLARADDAGSENLSRYADWCVYMAHRAGSSLSWLRREV